MGTRADFYVGRGESAEWLGSIAWDGHPFSVFGGENVMPSLALSERDWRDWVDGFLRSRYVATFPGDGWPWPWENSQTTDYAFAWDAGVVYGTRFGRGWWPVDTSAECAGEPEDADDDDSTEGEKVPFPTMSTERFARPGSLRSGTISILLP